MTRERILDAVDAAQTRVQRIGAGTPVCCASGRPGWPRSRSCPCWRGSPPANCRACAAVRPDLLTPAQEAALAEDRIDVAVLRPPLRRAGLASRLIAHERLVLAVPAQHRLAGDEPVALAELRDEDFVVYAARDSSSTPR